MSCRLKAWIDEVTAPLSTLALIGVEVKSGSTTHSLQPISGLAGRDLTAGRLRVARLVITEFRAVGVFVTAFFLNGVFFFAAFLAACFFATAFFFVAGFFVVAARFLTAGFFSTALAACFFATAFFFVAAFLVAGFFFVAAFLVTGFFLVAGFFLTAFFDEEVFEPWTFCEADRFAAGLAAGRSLGDPVAGTGLILGPGPPVVQGPRLNRALLYKMLKPRYVCVVTQRALNTNHPGHDHVGETAPLTPMDLGLLLGRVAHEFDTRNRIFDLPTGRFWRPDTEIDLGFEFVGRRAASPIGPAAGPHSQLAQNIVLAWLGGSRLFELKTVQILDELEIARPCIDMQTIGYNIEWSQELTLGQSLTEYVKASMLLDILSRWDPVLQHVAGPDGGPGPHVFDMSVGYDLAGISNPRVAEFITGMRDASAEVERLRSEIPEAFASFRDLDFTTSLSDTLTLSTFHGCPPEEIEQITKHLVDVHDLDVIVKLNPTLLGYETVRGIINDELGYDDVVVKESAFAEDLQFERGIELIGELNDYAAERGHRFGIKLTNTLVVENIKQWMPEDTMYLSGAPLHVLASSLLERLAEALPGALDIPGHDGDVMVSFSAGVSKDNLADTLAMGVNPATICSDLLKPGGYGRLAPMLKALTAAVAESGAKNLADWRTLRQGQATAAGHRATVNQHVAAIRGDGIEPYTRQGNAKLPREVDTDLQMFGCVACNFCITVCPNDAFFSIPSLEGQDGRQQYLVWSELCNECGNCMTFCPEDGDPAMVKPRLFTDESVFSARTGQGFLLRPDGTVLGRTEDESSAEATAIVAGLLRSEKGSPLPLNR